MGDQHECVILKTARGISKMNHICKLSTLIEIHVNVE